MSGHTNASAMNAGQETTVMSESRTLAVATILVKMEDNASTLPKGPSVIVTPVMKVNTAKTMSSIASAQTPVVPTRHVPMSHQAKSTVVVKIHAEQAAIATKSFRHALVTILVKTVRAMIPLLDKAVLVTPALMVFIVNKASLAVLALTHVL